MGVVHRLEARKWATRQQPAAPADWYAEMLALVATLAPYVALPHRPSLRHGIHLGKLTLHALLCCYLNVGASAGGDGAGLAHLAAPVHERRRARRGRAFLAAAGWLAPSSRAGNGMSAFWPGGGRARRADHSCHLGIVLAIFEAWGNCDMAWALLAKKLVWLCSTRCP